MINSSIISALQNRVSILYLYFHCQCNVIIAVCVIVPPSCSKASLLDKIAYALGVEDVDAKFGIPQKRKKILTALHRNINDKS